jgi:hypothetical protein
MSKGWADVSELRPSTGLLFIPQMRDEYGQLRWNDTDSRTEPGKTCPNATLFTLNPIWIDLGAKPGLRRESLVTNRPSHGTDTDSELYRIQFSSRNQQSRNYPISLKQKFLCRVTKSQSLVSNLKKMYSVISHTKISLRLVVIATSHLRLDVWSDVWTSEFPTKILYGLQVASARLRALPIISSYLNT